MTPFMARVAHTLGEPPDEALLPTTSPSVPKPVGIGADNQVRRWSRCCSCSSPIQTSPPGRLAEGPVPHRGTAVADRSGRAHSRKQPEEEPCSTSYASR